METVTKGRVFHRKLISH